MIPERLQLVLPSLFENIHQVEKFVEDICDEYNINNTYFGSMLVAVTEAFENAIKHGNNNDPTKNVTIEFKSKPEGLTFTISDEGNGFDISEVPDPLSFKSNSDEIRGRGIFLIKCLADEVKFPDKGKKVEIIFKISSINSELAVDRIKRLQEYSAAKETASSQNQKNKAI